MGLEVFVKAIVVLVLVISSLGGFAYYRSSLLQSGYNKARQEQTMTENYALIENQREITRLVGVNNEIQNRYNDLQNYIDNFARHLGRVEQQLREQQADFNRRLAEADAPALREYASALERNLEELRRDTREIGVESAKSSATAHALKQALDNITASREEVNEQQPASQY